MAQEDVAGTAQDAGTDNTVEIRVAARPALIPTVRAVASDLAARADFDLDAVSDLRMAVDEACATLVAVAAPGSPLRCTFAVSDERIEVAALVETAAGTQLPTDSFGWRVLQTLADHVAVETGEEDGGRPALTIRLHKRAGHGL
ncbi:ATP-binding protein [Pseudonocardia sp. ICBG1293]|uniref:ATP-binding protein n=1 Tax=Pseudonocardia sp. ICBG1293 TaxID=2844382 RepID=UPI001CCB4B0F|nr:ATP-binding protein [Pseudonocardia sp. ICBG1293]